jgi:Tfp pilus assembly protein PilP
VLRLSLLALLALVVLTGCGAGSPSQDARDRAVNEAMAAYRQAKADGTDLSRGPCIAEQLPGLADWVADVAHDPRQSVDDVPANQCQRFRNGQAHHFVELDTSGNLIRAQ